MNRPCVQTRVIIRRVSRRTVLVRKHVVRGATLSLIPDAVNDVVFHHAPINIDEVVHVIQDTTVIAILTAISAVLRLGL